MAKQKLVVLTGAGMSAESGIPTFRGGDGLWENHRIEDVATPEAWQRDPALVLEFYNQRRKGNKEALPNNGHKILAELEAYFDVEIITQNIDDLHERAGSTRVLHLHGEIRLARSTKNPDDLYAIDGWQLNMGDTCRAGSQLRPHIVWFGESVPMMDEAIQRTARADVFAVVGTSLQVYPAAGLLHYVPHGVPVYEIDPHI
ncbi:MAG: NAD-dependent deacylase, partial [Flavobacteriales bacterium]|nr:NAD-dependent deacylase [Flavobacteriales bacterium]